jgi:ATP-dependent DNA helicase HFM1/MER3
MDGLRRVIDVIPERFLSVFSDFPVFNDVQSPLIDSLLNTDDSMVIAAPTGSGKTALHELAMVRTLSLPAADGSRSSGQEKRKILYIAPNKALCSQRALCWTERFGSLGFTVQEVSGDVELNDSLKSVARADIVVCTPEKWDSISRRWREHVFLIGCFDLVLIDEAHILGEERGAVLEQIVVRMRIINELYAKRVQEASAGKSTGGPEPGHDKERTIRMIALSATLPNLFDIGAWLHCKSANIHYFDESFRPVPLKVHTISYGNASNPFLFEKSLNDKVSGVIDAYSSNKAVLVFCGTKNGTEVLARSLGQRYGAIVTQGRDSAAIVRSIQNQKLQDLVRLGIGYHHAGMPADDRALVEHLYMIGAIRILCSTTTLAHGVNLPAFLVIIKGTQTWRGSVEGYQRTCRSDIIQMLGRAGRPGYDTQGVAVIMTSNEDKGFYAEGALKAETIESHLLRCTVEAICAEVSQNVITDIAEAISWLRSTFFFVRCVSLPVLFRAIHSSF